MEKPVYYVLSVPCQKDDDSDEGKQNLFDLCVKFRDQNQFDVLEGVSFDTILEQLSYAAQKRYGDGWYIDDMPEVSNEPCADSEVDLDLTDFKEKK